MGITLQEARSQGYTMGPIGKDQGGGEGEFKSELATEGRKSVSKLIKIAESNPGIFGRTAALPLPKSWRSDAFRNYSAQIDSLKGNIIPAALTAMREASKTGGALGQVSDREGAWLSASLGALDMSQHPEVVLSELRGIDASLERWQTAVKKYGGQPSLGQTPRGTEFPTTRAPAGSPDLSARPSIPQTAGGVRIKDTQNGEIRNFPPGTVPPPGERYQIVQ